MWRTEPSRGGVSGTRCRRSVRAFTLVEIIVCCAIVATLMALVVPIASRTIASARGFQCQNNLRSVAYDFTVFADDVLHGDRGHDARDLSSGRFRIDTFQDAQYGVDEFWAWPGEDRHEVPDAAGKDPMRCAAVKGTLVLRSNAPCASGGVSPPVNVSFGFNERLRLAEPANGPPRFLTLTSAILHENMVPLAWDVDGAAAAAIFSPPFFSAPALDSPALFANDRRWYPGMRHNGAANFAFVDGHVETSKKPLENPQWRWGFTPTR